VGRGGTQLARLIEKKNQAKTSIEFKRVRKLLDGYKLNRVVLLVRSRLN
jgi:hypothetical protein